jgi:exosortase
VNGTFLIVSRTASFCRANRNVPSCYLAILLYSYCILHMQSTPTKQLRILISLFLGSLLVAAGPGRHLLKFAYETGDQSYILLVPVLSAMLIYRDQENVFASVVRGRSIASTISIVGGAILIATAYVLPPASELQMVVTALGLIAFWTGAFFYCFGVNSGKTAAFPLGMLLWIIPIPAVCIAAVTYFLQVGSTELVDILFHLTGTPVLRDGFVFQLSTQSIEVAKECSGIRSSLCLILLTLVIAHELLRSNTRRAVLLVSTIPIVILKNGVRIATLALLAVHVDPSFLTGHLHRDGGIVFFLLGLVMIAPIVVLLRRGEPVSRSPETQTGTTAAASV